MIMAGFDAVTACHYVNYTRRRYCRDFSSRDERVPLVNSSLLVVSLHFIPRHSRMGITVRLR